MTAPDTRSTRPPLDGRVAVVTGAGRGIGRAVALRLAADGADVVLAGRTASQLEEVAALAADGDRRALVVPTDITDEAAVERLIARARDELGAVDILVNNSGVIAEGNFLDIPFEEFDRVINTNLRGTALCCRAAGRQMVEQGSGRIISVASYLGLRATPGAVGYCVSKAGIIQLTRALAVEWARHGIQVNAVAPGYVTTEMNAEVRANEKLETTLLKRIPARRFADVTEVAGLVAYLAGPDSGYITGEAIVMDGGQLAHV